MKATIDVSRRALRTLEEIWEYDAGLGSSSKVSPESLVTEALAQYLREMESRKGRW